MEYFDDGKTDRIHGYSIGQISFKEGAEVNWKLWPRKGLINRVSRNRKIIPDHDNFELVPGQEYVTEQLVKSSSMSKSLIMTPTSPVPDLAVVVEEGRPLWNDALQGALYSVVAEEQHLVIRTLEQQTCIESIRHTKIAWVCADWGLGRDGFIWSVMRQDGRDMQPVYRVSLGDYSSRVDFLTHFETIGGCSFPAFCKALASRGPALLLFDEIPVSTGDYVGLPIERDVENLAIMVKDFCPDIVVLLLARTNPRDHKIKVIKLEPLDEADTRTYLIAHPSASSELISSHGVSEIFRRTDGLPGKIESILKTLRVVSLSELDPANLIANTSNVTKHESIPISLVKIVTELAESKDPATKRTYLLLKVLALLPHGESLQRLKRIDNQQPLFPKHAEELLDHDLIQVRSSTILIEIHGGYEDRLKILYALRPVRDYVISKMSNREVGSLMLKASLLYFGENWQSGKAFLKKLDNALTSDDGSLMENPHTIVMFFLKNPDTWKDNATATATLNLCNIYCSALYSGKHYRNCASVCRDVLSVIPGEGFESHRNRIEILFAKSLRMTGEHDTAKPLFEQLLAKIQSNAEKAELLLVYALCLQSLNDQKALTVAKEVVQLVPKTSHAMQAQSIIIEMNNDADRHRKLLRIEKDARKHGHNVVANNLALSRTTINDDYSSLRTVHSTAHEAGDAYTAARAAIKLGKLSIKASGNLSNIDLKNLINAYQYFYGERRTSIFSEAHEALWIYFNNRREIKNLLTLFRHSSFIWRLHSDEDKEEIYVQRLIESAGQILSTDILTADKNTAYFLLRAKKGKIGDGV